MNSNPLQSAGAQNLATVLNPSDISFSQQTYTNEAGSFSRQTQHPQIYGSKEQFATPMKKMTDSTASANSLVFKGGVTAMEAGMKVVNPMID